MALTDQEMATEMTKAACAAVLEKLPLGTAKDFGEAVATIYKIVFEAVQNSSDA